MKKSFPEIINDESTRIKTNMSQERYKKRLKEASNKLDPEVTGKLYLDFQSLIKRNRRLIKLASKSGIHEDVAFTILIEVIEDSIYNGDFRKEDF